MSKDQGLGLFIASISGAFLALFLGKIFAALVLGALATGIWLRFSRKKLPKS